MAPYPPPQPWPQVNCKWKDGNYYGCRILERRRAVDWEGPPDAPEAWEYYVHYHRSGFWGGGGVHRRDARAAEWGVGSWFVPWRRRARPLVARPLRRLRAAPQPRNRPTATTQPAVNRRMDDWVSTAALDLATVEPEVIEVRAPKK